MFAYRRLWWRGQTNSKLISSQFNCDREAREKLRVVLRIGRHQWCAGQIVQHGRCSFFLIDMVAQYNIACNGVYTVVARTHGYRSADCLPFLIRSSHSTFLFYVHALFTLHLVVTLWQATGVMTMMIISRHAIEGKEKRNSFQRGRRKEKNESEREKKRQRRIFYVYN